jgi:hypothetical protein
VHDGRYPPLTVEVGPSLTRPCKRVGQDDAGRSISLPVTTRRLALRRATSDERYAGHRAERAGAVSCRAPWAPGEWRSWQRTCFGSLEARSAVGSMAVSVALLSLGSSIIVWFAGVV